MSLVRFRALLVTVAITSALTVGVAVAPASAAPASFAPAVAAVHVKKKHVKVPKLVGLDGKSATKKLHAHHLKFKFDQDVWVQSNWTVDETVPKAGKTVKRGKTVTLIVSKHTAATTPAASAPAPAPATALPATAGGLTSGYGWTACEQYGNAQYPYGFKLHWITGALAATLDTAKDRWYLKAMSEVENQYGVWAKTNTECYVTGSDQAPVVTDFLTY